MFSEEKEKKGRETGLEIEWKYNQKHCRRLEGVAGDNGELNGGTKAGVGGRVAPVPAGFVHHSRLLTINLNELYNRHIPAPHSCKVLTSTHFKQATHSAATNVNCITSFTPENLFRFSILT